MLINYNKCAILVQDFDNGGGSACVRVKGIWEVSVSSTKFCWEPKTSPKNEVYFRK